MPASFLSNELLTENITGSFMEVTTHKQTRAFTGMNFL
jgi:hypothetical protein